MHTHSMKPSNNNNKKKISTNQYKKKSKENSNNKNHEKQLRTFSALERAQQQTKEKKEAKDR
jgi:hypothetical protein